MDENDKFNLITQNLHGIMNEQEMINILRQRNLKIYWGTAPTGKIHLGYLLPLIKIADFLQAGCTVLILFADLHSLLSSNKSEWNIIDYRIKYYKKTIKFILKQLNAPLDNLSFINGTDYQFNKNYTINMYKLMTVLPVNNIVSKDIKTNTTVSSLLYYGLQILDEHFIDYDAQLGGVDQVNILKWQINIYLLWI